MHTETRVERHMSRAPSRAVVAPVAATSGVHACAACNARTTLAWFCCECQERARPHRDDDPYDELGDGEGG